MTEGAARSETVARARPIRHNSDVELPELLGELNWVDGLVLLMIALYVASGVRRGFVMGVLDLLGMVVSLGAAILGYRIVAEWILGLIEIPTAIATLGAFLGLVLLAQLVFSAIVNLLFHLSRPVLVLLGPLAFADRSLGIFPGLAKGVIFSTLLMLPFVLFPLLPQVSAAIERSSLGSRLVVAAVETAPELESILGRDLNEGIAFLTPPQTDEGMRINFGPLGQLEPDPEAEQSMLELVNAERAREGLSPLVFDDELRDVGRAHSLEMFQEGYFAHISPNTGSPFDRMRRAGIRFVIAGENLAYAPNVQIAHEGLMNSPGHRANILRPEFGTVGIGVIRSDFRGSMFTQVFSN
jgi:uncharacterized protein YkwD/uncharacterized membrane protein required for colicin V production